MQRESNQETDRTPIVGNYEKIPSSDHLSALNSDKGMILVGPRGNFIHGN